MFYLIFVSQVNFILPVSVNKVVDIIQEKDFDVDEFFQALTYIIRSKQPDTMLVNFNENGLQKNDIRVRLQYKGFKQVFAKPTHIRRPSSDHIYVKHLWKFANTLST